ncbi:MAG: RusA family crossover junction endodeoxyribonuclease [Aphanizomenon flos-aquae Clear-A1]|jgi:Holliday junction resolvase RusA-like endonuclease|nr:RusA family crossover junction endodeoxyribonuclease [Aphanizomenon flos-aquae Clear-A1]
MSIIYFEFLIPRRPVSTNNDKRRKEWIRLVNKEAKKFWTGSSPIKDANLQLTLIYLCRGNYGDRDLLDTDNIIKPIQDALNKLVYEDDKLVSDVESHRRFLSEPIDITNLPLLLQEGVIIGEECVYVKVSESQPLEKYL